MRSPVLALVLLGLSLHAPRLEAQPEQPLTPAERQRWRQDLDARNPARRLRALERIQREPILAGTCFGPERLAQALWRRAGRDPDDQVRALAARLLGDETVLPEVELDEALRLLAGERRALVETALVTSLGPRLPATDRQRIWNLVQRPSEPQFRSRLLQVLGHGAAPDEAAALAILALEPGETEAVRWGAIRGLTHSGIPEAIPHLIEALAQGAPMLRAAAHEGLMYLTQQDLGAEPREWWALWERQGPRMLRERPSPVRPVTEVPRVTHQSFRFFGVQLPARPMVIAMDCSASMNLQWGRVIEEFERAVSALPPSCRLDVVFFNHELHHWRRYLVPAGPTALQNLLVHLREHVDPSGHTNIHDTLEYILTRMEPGEPYMRAHQVILVSDGEPNRGRYTEPGAILQSVRELRPKRVPIHTLALQRRGLELLEGLSRESGGTFTVVADR